MYKLKFINVCYFLIILICPFCAPSTIKYEPQCRRNDPAVKNFVEFLKIDTSSGKNLQKAVTFLQRQATELGLPFSVYYPDGVPICVMTWTGTNPSLPSLVLNSHLDVVTVEKKFWKYAPFSGHIDENCNIYGRGAQDTKGTTIQYIEAIRRLIQKKVRLQRTIHVTVMSDEETGGFHGIKPFVKTKEFQALNIGFALDEGLTSADDNYIVSYQDRRPWQMKFTTFGQAGHGSGMPSNSAMAKMYKLLSIIMKYREEQNELKKQLDETDHGSYTSININMIQGGSMPNVIPSDVSVVVDMRIAVDADVDAVQAMVESWRREVGNDTLLEFIRRDVISKPTSLQCNPYWDAMVKTAKNLGITLKPLVLPATTDMLVLRNIGIPALGFAPRVRTPFLFHSHDEYLEVDMFLQGIDTYVAFLKSLGNLGDVSYGA